MYGGVVPPATGPLPPQPTGGPGAPTTLRDVMRARKAAEASGQQPPAPAPPPTAHPGAAYPQPGPPAQATPQGQPTSVIETYFLLVYGLRSGTGL